MKTNILVVDDDPHIREVITFTLTRANFEVTEASNGKDALELFDQQEPDFIILDIGMPELDGTEVCRIIRQTSQVPIVFLSARDEEIDRVLGLELGADDYIVKPFSSRELLARIKTILRRSNLAIANKEKPELKHGYLSLNKETRQVSWNNHPIELTATEFEMLHTLMQYPGNVFTRELLMDGSYQHNISVSDRTIDSHLRRIRSKFKKAGGHPIETVHGVGYKINACDTLL